MCVGSLYMQEKLGKHPLLKLLAFGRLLQLPFAINVQVQCAGTRAISFIGGLEISLKWVLPGSMPIIPEQTYAFYLNATQSVHWVAFLCAVGQDFNYWRLLNSIVILHWSLLHSVLWAYCCLLRCKVNVVAHCFPAFKKKEHKQDIGICVLFNLHFFPCHDEKIQPLTFYWTLLGCIVLHNSFNHPWNFFSLCATDVLLLMFLYAGIVCLLYTTYIYHLDLGVGNECSFVLVFVRCWLCMDRWSTCDFQDRRGIFFKKIASHQFATLFTKTLLIVF